MGRIKEVKKYGYSNVVIVTKEFNIGDEVVVLSAEEYNKLLRE